MGPLKKQVFEQMNIEYTAVMRRFSSLGWVSIWDKSQPSVWLTAYCIKIFEKVSFQDWEDFIYIDPMVFGSSVMPHLYVQYFTNHNVPSMLYIHYKMRKKF